MVSYPYVEDKTARGTRHLTHVPRRASVSLAGGARATSVAVHGLRRRAGAAHPNLLRCALPAARSGDVHPRGRRAQVDSTRTQARHHAQLRPSLSPDLNILDRLRFFRLNARV